MDSQRKALMFITIAFPLFLQYSYQIQAESPSPSLNLVKELCGKTRNSTFCTQTLESDERTSKARSALEITKIFLSIGIKDANHSRDDIVVLSKSGGQKPQFRTALEACASSYNSTSFNFRSALTEVEEAEYETASYDIMLCYDGVTLCETALSDAALHVETISGMLNVTSNFINVAVTFTDIL